MKESFASAEAGLIGLAIFVVFFAAVLVWAFRPTAKSAFKQYGEIPLKDE